MRDLPASDLEFLVQLRARLQVWRDDVAGGLKPLPNTIEETLSEVNERISAARLELELGDAVRSEFARPSGDRQRSAAA